MRPTHVDIRTVTSGDRDLRELDAPHGPLRSADGRISDLRCRRRVFIIRSVARRDSAWRGQLGKGTECSSVRPSGFCAAAARNRADRYLHLRIRLCHRRADRARCSARRHRFFSSGHREEAHRPRRETSPHQQTPDHLPVPGEARCRGRHRSGHARRQLPARHEGDRGHRRARPVRSLDRPRR